MRRCGQTVRPLTLSSSWVDFVRSWPTDPTTAASLSAAHTASSAPVQMDSLSAASRPLNAENRSDKLPTIRQ